MLTTSPVGSAVIFLQQLIANNKIIAPVKNTPLSELSLSCQGVLQGEKILIDKATNQLNLEEICHEAVATSNIFNDKIQTASDHDVYIDRGITMASEVIQRNLNLVRSKVQPIVRETVEHIEVSLQNFTNVTFQTPILTDKIFNVFTHPFINDLIEDSAKDTYYGDFPFINTFPALSAEEIRELIPSMNADLDGRIDEVIEALGADGLVGLYVSAFVDGSISLRKLSRNDYILVMLMTNSLLTAKPARLTKEIDEFFNKLYGIRQQAALRVKNDLQQWKEAYSNGRLILQYPNEIITGSDAAKNPIVVHEDLYEEWLGAGGSPDMIYGAFFSDRPLHGDAILKDRAKYLYQAQQYLSQLQAANDSKRSSVIRRAIREKVIELIKSEQESNETTISQTSIEKFHYRLNEATPLELNDSLGFVTLLVCDSFYRETYAKKIIDGLNHYQKQYPTQNVEDLATLVIADILVEWVVNMMEIKTYGAD